MATDAVNPKLVDIASRKLLEWAEKVDAEKRHGTIAIELTFKEGKATHMREVINLTTK